MLLAVVTVQLVTVLLVVKSMSMIVMLLFVTNVDLAALFA